jgi:hypothetical protein
MYMGHVLLNMAHVHDKQRIKIGNKTWPMYMINKEKRWEIKHGPCT